MSHTQAPVCDYSTGVSQITHLERNDEIWVSRMYEIERFAKSVYGQSAEDVSNEAFLIFRKRNRYNNPPWWYFSTLLREAARNLGLWQEACVADIDALYEEIPTNDDKLVQRQRERIEEAVRYAAPAIKSAVALVLKGMDMGKAAVAVGITPSEFSAALHKVGKSMGGRRAIRTHTVSSDDDQGDLFVAGGAE